MPAGGKGLAVASAPDHRGYPVRHEKGANWRAVPEVYGPWWMAAKTFVRWSRLGVWERLLRQYFPKGMSLSALSQEELDTVATSLNDRPRKTLDFATPGEQFNSLLATIAGASNTAPGGVRSQT